ncbi:MAG TPA: histidine phosphotransferase family protein [Rickettsiales bacterium]|nr:histidine phosphotransferase family protein [Rickettsiales bacterium]
MIPQLKLAELLCTRLCHDLTGPIGAIANGTEFLSEETGKMQEQAIELIGSSAAQAVARLQFYRKAYGRINDDGEVNLESLRKTTADLFTGSKITLDWPDAHLESSGIPVSYKMGRILLNLVIIASATLLRGGTLSVRLAADDNSKTVQVRAEGKSIKWDSEIEQALSQDLSLEALNPKNVQANLTRLLAQEIDSQLGWHATEDTFTISSSRKL